METAVAKSKTAKQTVALSWHGQACFHLTSPQGTRILIDPIPDAGSPNAIGYKPVPMPADVVTISHEHFDHTNVGLAKGNPAVLRGLRKTAPDQFKAWEKHNRRFGDVRIYNVGVYHDKKDGRERGLNSVFVFETGDLRLAHLGDLGHLLLASQVKEIGALDVLMIPVGGFYTIEPEEADEVIAQLKPKSVVIPMHYKTDVLKIAELAPVEKFLKGKTNVERSGSNTLKLDGATLTGPMKIFVLPYK